MGTPDTRIDAMARDLQAFMDAHVYPVEQAFYEAIDTARPEWPIPCRHCWTG